MALDKLSIVIADYPVQDDLVYCAIGFKGGFCVREFLVDGRDRYVGNYAFCNVLFNYWRLTARLPGLRYDVQRASSFISFRGDREGFVPKFNEVMSRLLCGEYDEDIFEKAKARTKEAFERRYKNGEFRAKFKAYEFSDLNKRYLLSELIRDIERIDYRGFIDTAKVLLVTGNICAYVFGHTAGVPAKEIAQRWEDCGLERHTADIVVIPYDPYLRQDASITNMARTEVNLTVEAFDFIGQDADLFARRYIAEIFGTLLHERNVELYADMCESSIIFLSKELTSKKSRLASLTAEEYESAKKSVLGSYLVLMQESPELFAVTAADILLKGGNIEDYLSRAAVCDHERFCEMYKMADIKISEAQISLRMG